MDIGGNDGKVASAKYPKHNIYIVDKKEGWDIEKKGLPDGPWAVLFANHIIEHLVNPDDLLEECKRQMVKETILEIGTPNLAAWFNRFLFLIGYVPHSVELSTQYNVGKPFNWGEEPLGGHLRIFTVPALIELLKKHGFKIISVEGERSTYPTHPVISWIDRTATRISPTLASAFRIKCMRG